MATLINTKLLAVIVGLLTVLAGYAVQQHHALVRLEQAETLHAKILAAQEKQKDDFKKQLKKYAKEDNTWKDGAKAMQGFKLP